MADVHVLDHPKNDALGPGPPRQRQDAALVETAFDDHVDFDRVQPGIARRRDSIEDP